MASRYVYTCDICNREIKNSKMHRLEVDNPLGSCRSGLLSYYNKYIFQKLDICNKCYSKLRRYVRKLKEK